MTDDTMYTLVASSNRGHYALDDPQGRDITSGTALVIWLGGRWIVGSVEHAGGLYADETSGRATRGYYFKASAGSICGLCIGMQVRLI